MLMLDFYNLGTTSKKSDSDFNPETDMPDSGVMKTQVRLQGVSIYNIQLFMILYYSRSDFVFGIFQLDSLKSAVRYLRAENVHLKTNDALRGLDLSTLPELNLEHAQEDSVKTEETKNLLKNVA